MTEAVVALRTQIHRPSILPGHSRILDAVTLRKPLVRDLVGLDFTGTHATRSMVVLISRLSELREREVLALGTDDYNRLCETIHALMRSE